MTNETEKDEKGRATEEPSGAAEEEARADVDEDGKKTLESPDRRLDENCKYILFNPEILAYIQRGCVAELRPYSMEAVRDCFLIRPDSQTRPLRRSHPLFPMARSLNTEDADKAEGIVRFDGLWNVGLPYGEAPVPGIVSGPLDWKGRSESGLPGPLGSGLAATPPPTCCSCNSRCSFGGTESGL